jgi:hypothetical protein
LQKNRFGGSEHSAAALKLRQPVGRDPLGRAAVWVLENRDGIAKLEPTAAGQHLLQEASFPSSLCGRKQTMLKYKNMVR